MLLIFFLIVNYFYFFIKLFSLVKRMLMDMYRNKVYLRFLEIYLVCFYVFDIK